MRRQIMCAVVAAAVCVPALATAQSGEALIRKAGAFTPIVNRTLA